MRKSVLSYDDVMNQQRMVIYDQRNRVLEQQDVKENIIKMMNDSIDETVKSYLADTDVHEDWNIDGLRAHYFGWLTTADDFNYSVQELSDTSRESIISSLQSRAMTKYKALEATVTPPVMREIERVILLRTVDRNWIEHIDAMDELRQGIGLRSYGQHNPVVEYRLEGSEMFDEMIAVIREDTYKGILLTRIRVTNPEGETVKEVDNSIKESDKPESQPVRTPQVAAPEMPRVQMGKLNATLGNQPVKKVSIPVKKQQIGRNDPCPCGSGLKYKKCCGKDE
jgi:preprotein translocase subunit SecA